MQVRAAVLRQGADGYSFETVEVEAPREGEVLVRIAAVGMCHTDVRMKARFLAGDAGVDPIVLGHEGAGVVEKIGKGVTAFEEGDHVVLSYPSCGVCDACASDRPYGCDDHLKWGFQAVRRDGSTPLQDGDGGPVRGKFFGQSSFATHSLTGERNLVRVDEELPLATLAPLGCGIQTGAGTVMHVLEPEEEDALVVFGCGSVGLSAVMMAEALNVETIVGVDVHASRLALATELGATHTIDASTDHAVEAVREITAGGAGYSLETTGRPDVGTQAVACLKTFGTCAIVTGMELRTGPGKRVVGVMQGESIPQIFIPEMIAMWEAGRFPFDRLIRTYDFEDIEQAEADSSSGETVKPVLALG